MQDDSSTNWPIRADLHCHTTASDGQLSPATLVERAVQKGVDLLAITDHDTVAAVEPAHEAARGRLTLVSGVEFSCAWRKYSIHVVGLDMDIAMDGFRAAIRHQADKRWQRAETIAVRLCRAGLPDVLEQACRLAEGGVPGRPHFAKALTAVGAVPDFAAAFKRFLGAGKIGDVRDCWPELGQAVQWIKQAGGVAILAHPRKYRMTATRLRELLGDFLAVGGDGLEVLTGGQPAGDTGFLADLAVRMGCLGSLGSDFHMPGMHWNELGSVGPLPSRVTPVWGAFDGLAAR